MCHTHMHADHTIMQTNHKATKKRPRPAGVPWQARPRAQRSRIYCLELLLTHFNLLSIDMSEGQMIRVMTGNVTMYRYDDKRRHYIYRYDESLGGAVWYTMMSHSERCIYTTSLSVVRVSSNSTSTHSDTTHCRRFLSARTFAFASLLVSRTRFHNLTLFSHNCIKLRCYVYKCICLR